MELAGRLAIYSKSKGPASFHKHGGYRTLSRLLKRIIDRTRIAAPILNAVLQTLVEFYDVLAANEDIECHPAPI
jgi:hypothetical protein